jgi:hypothetical protein
MRCALALAVGLLVGPGCKRIRGCPPGYDADAKRSVEGQHLLCRDASGVQGLWIELHAATAAPRQVCPLERDVLEGEFKSFHPNGKPWILGHYMGGQKSGLWRQFDERGEVVAEGRYRLGRLAGGAPVGIAARCEQRP